jgi:LEA14-like dessication related protein
MRRTLGRSGIEVSAMGLRPRPAVGRARRHGPGVIRATIAAATAATLLLLGVAGCASLAEVIERPSARVVGAELTELSFDRAELTFDVEVDNPNPVGVQLAGIDYELLFEEASFLRGRTAEGISIAAGARSVVRIPVGVGYTELIDSVRSLADRRETDYRLIAGVSVDVPVLGRVRLPLERTGTIPVVRAPRVRVRELRVERLGLRGADLLLRLGVENPNAFGLSLDTLDYALRVNGDLWAATRVSKSAQLAAGGETALALPLSLDFAAMGRSVRDILLGDRTVAYNLSGTLDVATTLDLLPSAELPLSIDGEIGINR